MTTQISTEISDTVLTLLGEEGKNMDLTSPREFVVGLYKLIKPRELDNLSSSIRKYIALKKEVDEKISAKGELPGYLVEVYDADLIALDAGVKKALSIYLASTETCSFYTNSKYADDLKMGEVSDLLEEKYHEYSSYLAPFGEFLRGIIDRDEMPEDKGVNLMTLLSTRIYIEKKLGLYKEPQKEECGSGEGAEEVNIFH